jgi:hypothetical protein
MKSLNKLIASNDILWVSARCFIMEDRFTNSFYGHLVERNLLPTSFANKVYQLSIMRNCSDGIDFNIYCIADTDQSDIYDEVSLVLEAFLLWTGTLDLGHGMDGTRLYIQGVRHPTTLAFSNISLSAESLAHIKGVRFNKLTLDDDACAAIHDANLENLIFGSFLSVPNVSALQLGIGDRASCVFVSMNMMFL